MKIDLAVLVVVFFFGLLGMSSGAIRQVSHLGGLVAGWFGARPAAQIAGPLLAKKLGYPLLVATIGCSFAAFFGIYLIAVLVLRFVLARILPDGEHGWLNRLGGFAMGAAKAAILAFVLLSLLVFAEKPLASLWPDLKKETAPSLSVKLVRHHGLLASLPAIGGLEKILKAGKDPAKATALAEDPEFQALARDPRVRGLVDDQAIRAALVDGDHAALLSSVRVLEALNDPKLVERLARLDAGKPAAEKAPPARPDASGPGPAKGAPKGTPAPAEAPQGPRH